MTVLEKGQSEGYRVLYIVVHASCAHNIPLFFSTEKAFFSGASTYFIFKEEKMDTQNRGQKSAEGREMFPEPRGWAMKWVFVQQGVLSTVEQSQEHSNGLKKEFAEPRSWALQWDGFSLVERQ